jgi:type II secretory pathway component PulC
MAEDKPLTPERELLKLIEEPGAKVRVNSAEVKHKLFSLFSPVALKARFSFLKKRFKTEVTLQRLTQIEIKVINRVLELSIFVLILYLIGNFTISIVNLNKKAGLTFEIKKIAASSVIPEASLLKAASFYLEKARTRDIFKMGLASVAESKEILKTPISKIAEASQYLKLVGISWSEDPDVIIEDTKSKRAYFLKRGQIINDFEVKAIFKDKVILSYNGEEIELR